MHLFSSNRIYLIGYMGSGKSTVGKKLATALNYLFIDTDYAIENLYGKTVSEIFESEGEESFRAMETRLIGFLAELDRVVIATGGGLPIFNNNLKTLLKTGITIYLDCEVENLHSRITKSKDIRPLYNNKSSEEEQKKAIVERLTKRLPIYQEAHLSMNGAKNADEIVRRILTSLQDER